MQVNNILTNIEFTAHTNELLKANALDISADSRRVTKNTLFFAYKGETFDSHEIAEQLYKDGLIIGVVCEHSLNCPCIIVNNGRQAFAKACANWFGNPDKSLKLIGITGTNGKTTTTWLIEHILADAGIKSVRIGTTGACVDGKTYDIPNTTPSPYDFYSFLALGVKSGAKVAVAEVSSHALDQDRLYGVFFDIAVFTNLTGDHLDYHKDLESYYQAKKRLFDDNHTKTKIINMANEYGQRLYEEISGKKFGYGAEASTLFARNYDMSVTGIDAVIAYKSTPYNLHSPLVGKYNLENILAAALASMSAGATISNVLAGVDNFVNVPGRLEKIAHNGISVFVDYAHTDDALQNVLSALKQICEGRLIAIFGAGGDRDKTKRPRMGKAAQKYSDYAIVTSDNPRTEDPKAIIADVIAGMQLNDATYIEPDREMAIKYAISIAKPKDIVLIAGKGHEDYQIIGKTKYPFSDQLIVKKYLFSDGVEATNA